MESHDTFRCIRVMVCLSVDSRATMTTLRCAELAVISKIRHCRMRFVLLSMLIIVISASGLFVQAAIHLLPCNACSSNGRITKLSFFPVSPSQHLHSLSPLNANVSGRLDGLRFIDIAVIQNGENVSEIVSFGWELLCTDTVVWLLKINFDIVCI